MARAARTARSGSSSRVWGTPKVAMVMPPMACSTVPPKLSTSARTRSRWRSSMLETSSGSRSPASPSGSSISANSTDTSLRSTLPPRRRPPPPWSAGRWPSSGSGRPVRAGTSRSRAGVLGQDGLLEALEADAGLDAELVDQDLAGRPVGGQGVGLAARAVQGQHELAVEVLAQRVAPGPAPPARPPARGGGPRAELGLDPGLGGGDLELLDPDQLGPGDVGRGGHVGQGRAPPQGQGLAQQVGGPGRVAGGQGLAALPVQALEAVQVQALGVEPGAGSRGRG
jgi:hypothetical protein